MGGLKKLKAAVFLEWDIAAVEFSLAARCGATPETRLFAALAIHLPPGLPESAARHNELGQPHQQRSSGRVSVAISDSTTDSW
jgi:hypothetical protein